MNNQVDIKSKAITKYLLMLIHSQNSAHRPAHGPCLYICAINLVADTSHDQKPE